MRRWILCAAALVLTVSLPVRAHATISDATAIDGPSADIVDLGGVAMADDGTGGLVYRKRVAGRTHVFASRFDGTAWGAPRQVDAGQRFDSSWPQIAAAERGRLVVTWVQEFGTGTDRMFSAVSDAGSTGFQAPIPVDFNVGEATATYPSLAMNAVGTAYLTYRVVYATSQQDTSLPRGTVDADVRVARTTGSLWSVVGQPVDRNPQQPVAVPTQENSPRVGVDRNGNAIVAFSEPDDDQVDRVWARRVFGTSLGNVQQVSPSKNGEARLRSGVDAFALDVAGFGQGVVAYRQLADPDAGLPRSRIFTSSIPEAFSDKAASFAPARPGDGFPDAGPDAEPSAPSVAVTASGAIETAFDVGLQSVSTPSDDAAAGAPVRLDDGSTSVPGRPRVALSGSGAAAFAWRVLAGEQGSVGVLERRADGVVTRAGLSAPQGGVVEDLQMAGSGLGDAAVALLQGTGSGTQVAAGTVDAPAQQFAAQAPIDWVRSPATVVGWDAAAHAIGGVTYAVTVDDDVVKEDLKGTRATLSADDADDGVHTIVVIATDSGGQVTESVPATLQVDRTPPTARIRVRGRRATVTLSDGARGETSGISPAATRLAFGDGGRAVRVRAGTTSHRYRRGGTYRVRVTALDRAGNRLTLNRRVRVTR